MSETRWLDDDKFHDECGLFGVFNHPEAANLTYLGLYALQHRGQESAGIAASDGVGLHVEKAMGWVSDVFGPERLRRLPGTPGDRPRPLLDRGLVDPEERPADQRERSPTGRSPSPTTGTW